MKPNLKTPQLGKENNVGKIGGGVPVTENWQAPETMPEHIRQALTDFRVGKPVLVADDHDRENEVDAIMAAQNASTEWVAWMIRYTSGYLCAPMTSARADALALPMMVVNSQDSRRTAYTITCDAAFDITTGISAGDRALTLRILADPQAAPSDLIRPGHVVPLRARERGVLDRTGHTEAAVDMARLAGLEPVGVLAELVNDDGTMMRLHQAESFAQTHGLTLITIAELVKWRQKFDAQAPVETPRVHQIATAKLPTPYGMFQILAYVDTLTGAQHVVLRPEHVENPAEVPLVRVHSECLTGEAFGSLKCDCGPQLHKAMELVAQQGGAIVYLRGHEGRGIGLVEKIKAYNLQDGGADTITANTELGWPVDMREYGAARAILQDLGITRLRLGTNSPDKVASLQPEIEVTEVVPIEVGLSPYNHDYLLTKQIHLGHYLHVDAENEKP